MGLNGLEWQTVQIPFGYGLNQKGDKRAQAAPQLEVLLDAQFDELGALETRRPLTAMSTSILGGGSLANYRALAVNGDELLLFTDVAMYSWDARDSSWVLKDTHLAVVSDEKSVFNESGDQYGFDRAELNNTILYSWQLTGGRAYVAAVDATTGTTIAAPTPINGGADSSKLRLVPLQTKILAFYEDNNGDLAVKAIDPANVASSILVGGTALTSGNFGGTAYDVAPKPNGDECIVAVGLSPTTSYEVFKVTAGLTVTSSTKARTCDGPVAVAIDPTASVIQIARGNSTNIQGDRLTYSSLADAATGQAIGTCANGPVDNITAAFRSVQNSGHYRCYVFWTFGADVPEWYSKSNWVDDSGSLGTQGVFIRDLGIAARAFSYNGSVYLWGVFAEASTIDPNGDRHVDQNIYLLYRDDGYLVAHAADGFSAGYTSSPLAGVQLVSGSTGFAWCGGFRRIIPVGANASTAYAERAPREVTFGFDDDRARRAARLGDTLYITGSPVVQYDGAGLYEVGFLIWPWGIATLPAVTGNLANGQYTYKATWRWNNARGELDRSSNATSSQVTISSGPQGVTIDDINLFTTRKPAVTYELWRTTVDPVPSAPFYLVTSSDPTATDPNGWHANNTGVLSVQVTDAFADSVASTKANNPENDGVLAPWAPEPSSIIFVAGARIFLAGIAGSPNTIWYSKQRGDGEVVAFNGQLAFDVPPTGGAITAIAFLNETLVVFRESAIYAVSGDGQDNDGQGNNFNTPTIISLDVGARDSQSIGVTSQGILFKSAKGWHRLDRGWNVQYIGAQVFDYDDETIVATTVMPGTHEVRFLSSARMLVWDDVADQWGERTIGGGLDACVWNGSYVCLTNAGPLIEQADYSSVNYGMSIETPWIKMADLQGAGRVRWAEILGEFESSCVVHIQSAYDYETDKNGAWLWRDDSYWTPNVTTPGGKLQFRHGLSFQQCEAIKFAIKVIGAASASFQSLAIGGGITLTASDPGQLAFYATAIGDQTSGCYVEQFGNVVEIHYTPGSTKSSDVATAFGYAITHEVSITANTTPNYVWQTGDAYAHTPFAGATDTAASGGAGIKLTGLGLEVGVKRGLNRRLAAEQKG